MPMFQSHLQFNIDNIIQHLHHLWGTACVISLKPSKWSWQKIYTLPLNQQCALPKSGCTFGSCKNWVTNAAIKKHKGAPHPITQNAANNMVSLIGKLLNLNKTKVHLKTHLNKYLVFAPQQGKRISLFCYHRIHILLAYTYQTSLQILKATRFNQKNADRNA